MKYPVWLSQSFELHTTNVLKLINEHQQLLLKTIIWFVSNCLVAKGRIDNQLEYQQPAGLCSISIQMDGVQLALVRKLNNQILWRGYNLKEFMIWLRLWIERVVIALINVCCV